MDQSGTQNPGADGRRLNKDTAAVWVVFGMLVLAASVVMLWPVLFPVDAQGSFEAAKERAYERRVARDDATIVEALADMPEQSQFDLETYLEQSLREAAGEEGEQQSATAIERFEDMWHPGIAAMSNINYPDGYRYGGVTIQACANLPAAFEPYYHSPRTGPARDPNTRTDIFHVGEWTTTTAAEIEVVQGGAQGVAAPEGYDGTDFLKAARPRFAKAWLYRDRDGTSTPILGLWAIDDEGSWWLVGVTAP